MAHTGKFYGLFLDSLLKKKVDVTTDTIKVMLCTSAYTPDQDTHQYKSSVTNEVSGTGYTATGMALATVTLTYNATTNTIKLDADDVSWTGATLTARHAVIYDSTPGSDATRPLIGYVTFDADISSTAAPFQLIWDSSGIFTMTVS